MPVGFAGRLPVLNEALVLHVVQYMPAELAFVAHRRGKLPTDAFDGTAKNAAVVKLLLVKAVRAEFVRLGFEDFGVVLNELLKLFVLLARDYAHAAAVAFCCSVASCFYLCGAR